MQQRDIFNDQLVIARARQSAIYSAKCNFRNYKSCLAFYCFLKLDCGSCVV